VTLNEYIIANADRGGDEGFLRQFGSTELFFSIDVPNDQLKDGPLTMSSNVELNLQLAKLDIGRMALFYASKQDTRLSKRFAGIPLIRAAEIVCNARDLDGMLIQSDGDAWFVAKKDTLRNITGMRRA
jgi:hypothetical protein